MDQRNPQFKRNTTNSIYLGKWSFIPLSLIQLGKKKKKEKRKKEKKRKVEFSVEAGKLCSLNPLLIVTNFLSFFNDANPSR